MAMPRIPMGFKPANPPPSLLPQTLARFPAPSTFTPRGPIAPKTPVTLEGLRTSQIGEPSLPPTPTKPEVVAPSVPATLSQPLPGRATVNFESPGAMRPVRRTYSPSDTYSPNGTYGQTYRSPNGGQMSFKQHPNAAREFEAPMAHSSEGPRAPHVPTTQEVSDQYRASQEKIRTLVSGGIGATGGMTFGLGYGASQEAPAYQEGLRGVARMEGRLGDSNAQRMAAVGQRRMKPTFELASAGGPLPATFNPFGAP